MTPSTPTSRPATAAEVAVLPVSGVALLLRLRYRLLCNYVRQAMREQPIKVVGTAASILLIWLGLYVLLVAVMREIRGQGLEGIAAQPLMFTFFFLALSGMLAFSTAILSYGGLFRQHESGYLLASPLPVRDVVIVKYLENLLLSSWSLLLLGLPLMMAMADNFTEPWSFYPLFLGIFLTFIPMPGALGMLLAWFVALVAPKRPRRVMVMMAVVFIALAAWWAWDVVHAPVNSSTWLKNFYDRVSIVRNPMAPHTWVANGISHAVQGRSSPAAFYLFVTLANGLFASLIAVTVVSGSFTRAFARAQVSGARSIRRSGRVVALVAEVLFAYLPRRQRLLAAKDLKTFLRDPLQWTQMAILFGLLALYVSSIPEIGWLRGDLADPRLQLLIAFLNLVAVSLILATFPSRFVFPLVSLEGQQLWLLGLLPLPRRRVIVAKFLYALTITLLAAVSVMSVSIYRLELPRPLAVAHLIAAVAICVGLCGVSIGMGARLPVFTERNPARIAGGFGGTVSLLISVGLVVISLTGVGVMTLRAADEGLGGAFTSTMIGWLALVIAANGLATLVALTIGIRHFNRLQW